MKGRGGIPQTKGQEWVAYVLAVRLRVWWLLSPHPSLAYSQLPLHNGLLLPRMQPYKKSLSLHRLLPKVNNKARNTTWSDVT